MSQSREKLVTDGRTDGRTKVNLKDLEVGLKIELFCCQIRLFDYIEAINPLKALL